MKLIRVKNWEEHQHYKDRNPIWIKLYNSILDNYEYACLQDASKLLLVHLWLLASKTDNSIPDDLTYLQKKLQITFNEKHITALISSSFIERYQDASKTLATCLPREEKNREENISCSVSTLKENPKKDSGTTSISINDKQEKYSADFELFWKEYPHRDTDSKANAYKAWIKATDRPNIDIIIAKVKYYKTTDTVKRGYGQLASTWINKEGWTIETPIKKENTLLKSIMERNNG